MQNLIDKKGPCNFLEPIFSLYNSMHDGNYDNLKVDKKISRLAKLCARE